MRELLFRGQRVDNGEWMYGDYQQNIDCVKIREKESGKEPDSITSQGIKEGGKIAKSYVVVPETVGQYTGLKDKNGKKIFEGDILNMHGGCEQMDISEYDVVCKVVYGRTGYGSEIGFSGEDRYGFRKVLMLPGALEVIGNIHDNPELLKGGAD